jgi:hypothetical protein
MDIMEVEAEVYVDRLFEEWEKGYEGDRMEEIPPTEAPLPAPQPVAPEVPEA